MFKPESTPDDEPAPDPERDSAPRHSGPPLGPTLDPMRAQAIFAQILGPAAHQGLLPPPPGEKVYILCVDVAKGGECKYYLAVVDFDKLAPVFARPAAELRAAVASMRGVVVFAVCFADGAQYSEIVDITRMAARRPAVQA